MSAVHDELEREFEDLQSRLGDQDLIADQAAYAKAAKRYNELEQIVEGDVVRAYYPHSTSHWLGLDVHDVGRYRFGEESVALEPGMVLTVEPGLYIRLDAVAAPAQYRGIGVRIEDDVLVTETGYDVLSAAIPSDPDELERIVAGG